jgi:hypothetical protein
MAPHIKQSDRSYAEQAQSLKGCKDLHVLRDAHPKPSVTATEKEAGAYRLPFSQVPMLPVQVGVSRMQPPRCVISAMHMCRKWQLAQERCSNPAMVILRGLRGARQPPVVQ